MRCSKDGQEIGGKETRNNWQTNRYARKKQKRINDKVCRDKKEKTRYVKMKGRERQWRRKDEEKVCQDKGEKTR